MSGLLVGALMGASAMLTGFVLGRLQLKKKR